jgi:hypothetical protein
VIFECPECGRREHRKPSNEELRWVGDQTVLGVCPDCELAGAFAETRPGAAGALADKPEGEAS